VEFSYVQELVHRLKTFQAMSTDVISVGPAQRMREAQTLMRSRRISGMPVVENERLVGIVTIEDIIQALDHGHIEELVGTWMTRDVMTVESRWPLSKVMSVFDRTGFGRLPVLDEAGKLCGLITPESILHALLVELNRLLAQDAEHGQAFLSEHQGALRMEFEVAAGDYDSAGLSSVRLKRELANRKMPPELQRRVAIATYEAEANLIIHTDKGGRIVADLDDDSVRVSVDDGGPGIPDLEAAMTPGFSTASDLVRNLGFGAGLGLPNIKRCADHFEIRSAPGYGTRLNLRFDLQPKEHAEGDRTAHITPSGGFVAD
jgi:CBS domain-containing protein/anti-sigma regulatory factor (Ser/Thr protein kinase)